MFKNKKDTVEIYELEADSFEFDIEGVDVIDIGYYPESKWLVIEYFKYQKLYSCKVRCNEVVYTRLLNRFKRKIGE